MKSVAGTLLALALLGSVSTHGDTLLQCGKVIDVENKKVLENTDIHVQGEKIIAVGSNLPTPENTEVVDLSEQSCAPGFMDMHVHLAHDGGVTANPFTFSRSAGWRAMRSLANAQAMLERGFTTIRTLGFDRYFETIDVRDSINAGEHQGPRIFVAPHGISGEGYPVGGAISIGKPAIYPEHPGQNDQFIRMGTGTVELRKLTAQEISYGADWIKLIDAEGHSTTVEDLKAIVEEAHRLGARVTQHVTMDPNHHSAKQAVAAGVDSIDHAFITDKKVLKDMAKQGIFYVPTIWIIDYLAQQEPGFKISEGQFLGEGMAAAMAPMRAMLIQNTKLAHELGVKIAMGSDTVFEPPYSGDAVEEFALLAEAMGNNWDALRAGTLVSAEMLGQENLTGSITAGKYADIVAMPGNPVEEITATEKVNFVMKGGEIIRQD